METEFFICLDKYKDLLSGKSLAVGVSGGSDSVGLLLVLDKWAKQNGCDVTAITVDHKLRSESTNEADYVAKLCQKIGVKHVTLTWDGEKPTSNIELKAREARYKLIANYCAGNSIKYLLTAHHMDDQAETFFIRLFRGSGIDGLASMQDINDLYGLTIVRPFLTVHKQQIKNYLLENNVKWFEDESNSDEKFLRNKIRKFINSFENSDEIVNRINFAVEEINKTKQIVDVLIEKIERSNVKFDPFGSCIFNKKLLIKKDVVVLKILAKIAMNISGDIYKPRLEKLKRLLFVLRNTDSVRYTFYGCIFETYNENLFIVYREYNAIGDNVELIYNDYVVWDDRFKIKLNKNIKDVMVTHVKDGEFNSILMEMRKTDYKKYREMKEIRGIEKKIFYTLPTICINGKYLFDCDFVDMELIKR